MSAYGIRWNEELDIETETIYKEGETVSSSAPIYHGSSAKAVNTARAEADISQKQLAERAGMDQSDISKIERGVSNPSVATVERIAAALHGRLHISIDRSEPTPPS